jgi:NADH-quinone oxidoreductase subunit J
MRDLLFYLLAASMLIFSTLTVTARNLFHAALCLLGSLVGTAVIFVLLGAETVALGQILVYVGGILIFVLYSIFLTTDMAGRMEAPSRLQKGLGFVASLALFSVVSGKLWVVTKSRGSAADFASLQAVGERLLHPGAKGFLVPFEVISILLLVALVGSLAIVRGLDKESP